MISFFTYERDFARRWTPVVYHDDKPKSATPVHSVPSDCLDMDGSPRFAELQRRFPEPVDPADREGEA